MLLDYFTISLLQAKNTPVVWRCLNWCQLWVIANCVQMHSGESDRCFYCQALVTAALHTFPSLWWPKPESVFKHIQTPYSNRTLIHSNRGSWMQLGYLDSDKCSVTTATCVFNLCLCSHVHTYCVEDWKWYTLRWTCTKLNIFNLSKGHVVQQKQVTDEKAECACFQEKTVIALTLSLRNAIKGFTGKRGTDGGHGPGEPSVPNQRCCSASSDVHTLDIHRKCWRKTSYQLCRHKCGAVTKGDSGSLLQPDVGVRGC